METVVYISGVAACQWLMETVVGVAAIESRSRAPDVIHVYTGAVVYIFIVFWLSGVAAYSFHVFRIVYIDVARLSKHLFRDILSSYAKERGKQLHW